PQAQPVEMNARMRKISGGCMVIPSGKKNETMTVSRIGPMTEATGICIFLPKGSPTVAMAIMSSTTHHVVLACSEASWLPEGWGMNVTRSGKLTETHNNRRYWVRAT